MIVYIMIKDDEQGWELGLESVTSVSDNDAPVYGQSWAEDLLLVSRLQSMVAENYRILFGLSPRQIDFKCPILLDIKKVDAPRVVPAGQAGVPIYPDVRKGG